MPCWAFRRKKPREGRNFCEAHGVEAAGAWTTARQGDGETGSGLALLLQPVLSALLAWMWLGEAVGPLEWFGGALVLFGLAAGTGAIKWTQFLPRSAHAAALRTRTPD